MIFGTKARTLQKLIGGVRSAQIAELFVCNWENWSSAEDLLIEQISKKLVCEHYIVRSSCNREDGIETSNAGAFLSILNVPFDGLAGAIKDVFSSYGTPALNDEVLIQPMLANVVRSGVAFSHDPNTSAPYRVVNWIEGSDTTIVTGGQGGETWVQAAKAAFPPPKKLKAVLRLVDELFTKFEQVPIDVEFAVTKNGRHETLWLLQVRPLILNDAPLSEHEQGDILKEIYDRVSKGMKPNPFIVGKKTVYGVMPDWNPAEIVGIRPKPLALSLYRELITDTIWAYQRHNYGYRNLRSFPLMPNFFGLPYIDVRLSFNSFIPATVSDNLASKLVDYYVDRLVEEPSLHDKVEFDIVYSCYTLDLPKRIDKLLSYGFSRREVSALQDDLRILTNNIFHPQKGLWRKDAAKIEILNQRRSKLHQSSFGSLEKIYWFLEDAKRYGTLPFAGLARAGFIAVQMLKSLVSVGIFSTDDQDKFLASVSTVSKNLVYDKANMDKSDFLVKYGHLRPGTYDILSTRYDETPDLYFNWSSSEATKDKHTSFSLTLQQLKKTAEVLKEHDLEIEPVELFDFIKSGIELRESSKFHFSKNLSDALRLIVKYGSELGIPREDLAFSNIADFRELYVSSMLPERKLLASIQDGKERYGQTLRLSLPPLIVQPSDVWGFSKPNTEPNFVTQKQIIAPVTTHDNLDDLKNVIVCIPNADPGFDWLFSYEISGLITAWGGVNSHMAIRAGELGLPAVIGAGEELFSRWSSSSVLHLDCAAEKVEIIK